MLRDVQIDYREDMDRKSSTTSSMYIASTITNPNVKSIIQAVSTILHSQMLEVNLFSADYSIAKTHVLIVIIIIRIKLLERK